LSDFDLIIIGGGTAALPAAMMAPENLKIALIEEGQLAGT